MSIEAMKQMVEALEDINSLLTTMTGATFTKLEVAVKAGRQAIAEAEKQEPVAVKHMMEWVTFLKARSDNGQHKQIPSNLSAGACWDLAVELEQFINTHPQPKREPLTDEQIDHILRDTLGYVTDVTGLVIAIEAAHGIKGES